MEIPETRYTRSYDGSSIAYQTLGEGPTDIVLLPNTTSIDLMWEEPSFARALRRLSGMGRLICLDYRGMGGSDPVALSALPTVEAWMEDVRVVLDTVGSRSAAVVANGPGGGVIGLMFAATYPERTSALILIDAYARFARADDYAFGLPHRMLDTFMPPRDDSPAGTRRSVQYSAPSRMGDEAFARWNARFERAAANPATLDALARWVIDQDLRAVLPTIQAPTLVLHREHDPLVRLDHGRYLADNIAGARMTVLPGTDMAFYSEDVDELLDHVEEFVTGVPPVHEPDRALATVLFTDIVDSTGHAARLGDRRWTDLLNEHDRLIERQLQAHRGQKVHPTGDGIVATFDGPARAVHCAQAICSSTGTLGIELRAGLHTGEVELRNDGIDGIAVHIGQRISALAMPREVLVSRTVTDLVVGSGLLFEARGERELKGVPGLWSIYALTSKQ